MTVSSLATEPARDLIREHILREYFAEHVLPRGASQSTEADILAKLAIEAIEKSPDIHLIKWSNSGYQPIASDWPAIAPGDE